MLIIMIIVVLILHIHYDDDDDDDYGDDDWDDGVDDDDDFYDDRSGALFCDSGEAQDGEDIDADVQELKQEVGKLSFLQDLSSISGSQWKVLKRLQADASKYCKDRDGFRFPSCPVFVQHDSWAQERD